MRQTIGARESTIWQNALQGDLVAFSELFDLYAKSLVSYAYKISLDRAQAKDAVQEVFLYIWQNRTKLAREVEVRFYLYSAVKRATLKQMKSFSLEGPIDENSGKNSHESPEATWIDDETESSRAKRMEKSLKALSVREREIISLKYFSNLKIREISVILGIREQTVSNTLQNALSKLRKHLSYLLVTIIFLLG